MADNNELDKIEDDLGRLVNVARSGDYKLFYSDRAEFRVSPFDVKINLYTTQELPTKETLLVEHATLIMSPQHAKQFCEVLLSNIESYEREFGELNTKWIEKTKLLKSQATAKKSKGKPETADTAPEAE